MVAPCFLCSRHQQGDLHHQRYRIAEQRVRHTIKKRKVFPSDDSVKKVVWLVIQTASQKWTMPLKDWRMAMSRFIIEFGHRRHCEHHLTNYHQTPSCLRTNPYRPPITLK